MIEALNMRRSLVGFLCITAMMVVVAPEASAAEAPSTSTPSSLDLVQSVRANAAGARSVFTIIRSIPDSVSQRGAQATQDWLDKNYGGASSRAFMSDLGKCAGGIAVAIGANLTVFAKVLKIKAAIRGLGGVAALMEQIADKTKRGEEFLKCVAEVFEGAGYGLGSIAVDILSLQGVADNCF